MARVRLMDCTLRDGGYYNNWDFSHEIIQDYLIAMEALNVDYVEIGFRSLKNEGFKGACAYSSDTFLDGLEIPEGLLNKICVMLNGAELLASPYDDLTLNERLSHQNNALDLLFSERELSKVNFVRIACHANNFVECLPASKWLKSKGYKVGYNLMQITDLDEDSIIALLTEANNYPLDALYFADSMGGLAPSEVSRLVELFKKTSRHEIGIHAHDNMGQAINNTLQALQCGVTWADMTVTGMGRGAGNAQTEFLAFSLDDYRTELGNPTKLLELVRKYFKPMQNEFGWGANPYYYLAGRYGIHPSYIQEMISDSRYNDEDILAVINHLKVEVGAKKYDACTLDSARNFYSGSPVGKWEPIDALKGKDVLVLGAGESVVQYRDAIEGFIQNTQPYVIALNTHDVIDDKHISARAACHPVRLLADCRDYESFPHPLITPASMLPDDVKEELSDIKLLDYGLSINPGVFESYSNYCVLPSALVAAYALAIAAGGGANKILLAGFDGYCGDDERTKEMEGVFREYRKHSNAVPVISLTPTHYELQTKSIYGLI